MKTQATQSIFSSADMARLSTHVGGFSPIGRYSVHFKASNIGVSGPTPHHHLPYDQAHRLAEWLNEHSVMVRYYVVPEQEFCPC